MVFISTLSTSSKRSVRDVSLDFDFSQVLEDGVVTIYPIKDRHGRTQNAKSVNGGGLYGWFSALKSKFGNGVGKNFDFLYMRFSGGRIEKNFGGGGKKKVAKR